jgi:uncharacterized protein
MIIFSCHQKDKMKIFDKWDNGNPRIVNYYDNIDGTLTFTRGYFHINRKPGSIGKYVNGKQDGHWLWWYDNGNKMDEATYKNGSYIGERKHWWKNGKLKQIEIITGECSGDCCNGKIINYDKNGLIEDEYFMLEGEKNGKYIYRYENGQAKKEEYFVNGLREGSYFEWFADGKKWVEGFYKNNKQDGKWIWWDSLGNIQSKHDMKDDEYLN